MRHSTRVIDRYTRCTPAAELPPPERRKLALRLHISECSASSTYSIFSNNERFDSTPIALHDRPYLIAAFLNMLKARTRRLCSPIQNHPAPWAATMLMYTKASPQKRHLVLPGKMKVKCPTTKGTVERPAPWLGRRWTVSGEQIFHRESDHDAPTHLTSCSEKFIARGALA